MSSNERRAALSLATIFAFRMLGLFMILPVFALHAEQLPDATPILIGLAIGSYGLTQALLQIPFGMLSDRIGRKPVIVGGLLLFALGSVVAAEAETLHGIIFGRILQGSGAIAAAIMALTADLVREQHRLKAMATIGMTIGFSFLVAMVAGPILGGLIGVPGIFWGTALLALAGIAVLQLLVPNPPQQQIHRDTGTLPSELGGVLQDRQLLRLDFGILTLHLVLTAGFIAIPLLLRDAGLEPVKHWQLYLPVMLLAMAAAIPFIVVAEKRRLLKRMVIGAVALLLLTQLLLASDSALSIWLLALLLLLFFTAFNLLEATLPSLVAKCAPVAGKGTAMGVYSSSQFIGAFIGGVVGGALYGAFGAVALFGFSSAMLTLWLLAVVTMREPRYLASELLAVSVVDEAAAEQLLKRLLAVSGVAEAVVQIEEGVAYLKVDRQQLDRQALAQAVG